MSRQSGLLDINWMRDSPCVWGFSVENEYWLSYILLSTCICFFIDKCWFSCVSLFTFVFCLYGQQVFLKTDFWFITFKILFRSLKSNTKVHQNHCINNKTWWFYQYLKTSISQTNSLRESRAMEKHIWGLLKINPRSLSLNWNYSINKGASWY